MDLNVEKVAWNYKKIRFRKIRLGKEDRYNVIGILCYVRYNDIILSQNIIFVRHNYTILWHDIHDVHVI